MDENFKRALEFLNEDIVNDFDPTYLWGSVLNNRELTEKITNDMKRYSNPNDFEKKRRHWVEQILAVLPTGDNAAFHTFVKNIREGCGQEYLAAALEKQAVTATKTPIRNEYANINMDEFLGLNNVLPNKIFLNRIRICDFSREQIGILQFQIIHKIKKDKTKLGTLYSFFIADESGGIHLNATERKGQSLDVILNIRSFFQLSTWNLTKRNKDIPSLSNHEFELWVDELPSVSPIDCIPDARPIIPLNSIRLTTLDRIPFLPEEGNIDIVALVHEQSPKDKEGLRKVVELRNTKTKNAKHITVECVLFDDNVNFITKKDVIVVIKNAIIKKTAGVNRLWANNKASIFVINDSFDEAWVPADQLELITSLKTKPRSPKKLAVTIEDASNLNSEQGGIQNTSGPSRVAIQNNDNRITTPLSSSTTNSRNGQSPRRSGKRKTSLLDVDKQLRPKKLKILDATLVSDVMIVQATIDSYIGCPNDNCTRKAVGPPPYMCSGPRCKDSPLKNETKSRYILKCNLRNDVAPEITKNVTVFDKMARKLFDLVAFNPLTTIDKDFVEKLKSFKFNIEIKGDRKEVGSWNLIVQNVELSEDK